MDAFAREVYLHELETQCRLARDAGRSVDQALANRSSRGGRDVFRGLHSLLTHASNVSKLLWPRAQRHRGEKKAEFKARSARIEARGSELRRIFELPDHGHLLADRTLRNHLEHFDESLEEWERTSERRNYVQDMIGAPAGFRGLEATDMMRCFDPGPETFHFRGESYSVRAIRDAVEELLLNVLSSFADPRLVAMKLAEEFPDTAFTWDAMRTAVTSALFADERMVSRVASLGFAPSMVNVAVDLGSGPPIVVPLGEVSVPGPLAQAAPIVECIVAAVLHAEKHASGTTPPV